MKQLVAIANAHFEDQFSALEALLEEQLDSKFPEVADLGKYVVESGGKRFRPALTFLFHKIFGASEPQQSAVELGAVIEMIHLATLAHDDVIDLAETRRNHPSLWAKSGNRAAILEGDFIFSRAFRMLNSYPEYVREVVINAVEEVLQGQILQEHFRGKLASIEEYDKINHGKTAALISAAAVLGAWAGDPKLEQNRLQEIHQAGLHMGNAFQMIDDMLDVFGDHTIGKPLWGDQRGGWLTWPYLTLLERMENSGAIAEQLLSGKIPESQQQALTAKMEQLNIRHDLLARAEAEIDAMKSILEWIPDSELKRLLLDSSDFVIQRTR